MIGAVKYANGNDLERVKDFFLNMDDHFEPSLTGRPQGKTLDDYLGIALKTGKVLFYEKDGEILGAMGYSDDGETITGEISGVVPNRRGSVAYYRLWEKATHDYAGISQKVRVETWQGNDPMIEVYEKMGFSLISEEYDPELDRITSSYEADCKEIKSFFDRKGSSDDFKILDVPTKALLAASVVYMAAGGYLLSQALAGKVDFPFFFPG